MDEVRKSERDIVRHGPLIKLHVKVQSKYLEMQRKLEKSRSVDSVFALGDNYSHKGDIVSNGDITELDNGFDNEKSFPKHLIEIEEVKESTAVETSALLDGNSVLEAHFEYYADSLSPLPFYSTDFNASTETLHEVPNDKTNGEPIGALRRKISLRERIGSAFHMEKLVLTNIDTSKKKLKTATCSIAIINVTFVPENEQTGNDKPRALWCRLRLGAEKQKSKILKSSKLKVTFQELFSMNVYDDNMLQMDFFDKDSLLGKTIIDLSDIEQEKTHKLQLNLEQGTANVRVFILLTLSGIANNTFTDIEEYRTTLNRNAEKFKNPWNLFTDDFSEVGQLVIVIYKATGLPVAENYYCTLQFGNETLQTQTVTKTTDPVWNKIFTFTVTDVTTILYITLLDEKKQEVAGKIAIFLLNIGNDEIKWYALKDSTLREPAKGDNAKILIEINLTWNLIKASLRVVSPKEKPYMQVEPAFRRHLFAKNVARARIILDFLLYAVRTIKTCFEWESRMWNTLGLAAWLLFCWFFKAWMVPLLLLLPFIWFKRPKYFHGDFKNLKVLSKQPSADVKKSKLTFFHRSRSKQSVLADESVESSNDEGKASASEKSKTLRQKIHSLQDIVLQVQNGIGSFASLGERIKNLFNFTVPFLSCLAIFFIMFISVLVYFVPVKYIFMAWATHKYLRKTIKPNRKPNNEILDLLSRVPDDETLIDCKELDLQQKLTRQRSDKDGLSTGESSSR